MNRNIWKCGFAMTLVLLLVVCLVPIKVAGQTECENGGIKLGQPGAIPPKFSLNPFISWLRLRGDVISSGTGLRSTGPPTALGTITISEIPPLSTVVSAYLYWSVLGNGTPPTDADIGMFNGAPVTGTILGSDISPCWLPSSIYSFRANVTRLVPGNGTYTLDGFVDSGDPDITPSIEGASLVVTYANAALPLKDITIYDGTSTVMESTDTTTIEGFEASSPVTRADLTMIVADGQTWGDSDDELIFNGVSFGGNNFDGDNGFLWDDDRFDVTTLVPGGSTSVTVTLASTEDPLTGSADCLTWTAAALSVSAPPFDNPSYYTFQDCALSADQSCLIGFSTFLPFFGDASRIVSLGTSVCGIGDRFLNGDPIGALTKFIFTWVEATGTTIHYFAEMLALPYVPIESLENALYQTLNCIEAQMNEYYVELCGGMTKCVIETIKQGFESIKEKALSIFTGSPVTIEVSDGNGNRIFIDSEGNVNAEIPRSWLYNLGDDKQLVLINNQEGEYSIVVTGKPEAVPGDTFDLGIVLSENGLSFVILYEGVSTQAGSTATLTVGEQVTDFNLHIDIDGDGNVDYDVQPTSIIGGEIQVLVDIKPGSDPNCIKATKKGVTPVAILASAALDANTIDVSTIEIDGDDDPATAGVSPVKSSTRKDVNKDGLPDLVVHFSTPQLNSAGLLLDGNTLYITGTLDDGTEIIGSDVINLAGGPNCF